VTPTTIPKPTDRDEWLAARAPYVGASEAAALVGEHPFITLAELAVRKIQGTTQDDNAAMRRGRHLEHAIASWWEEDHGIALVEPTELYVHGDVLIATLDRRVVGTDIGIEIKTSNHLVTECSRYWYWQTQVQMLCAELGRVDVVVLDPSMVLKGFTVLPQRDDQEMVAEAAAKFLDHVRAGELPPDVELNYKAATALHPKPEVQSTELDDETLRRCGELARLQDGIKHMQAEEDRLKGAIGHRLGDAAEGRHDGRTIVTWRSITRTVIDNKRLRAELPDLAAEYSTQSSYRQLRLK
jgi:putative phage-type endonuclease